MEKSKVEYVKDYILLNILNNIYQKNTKIPSEKKLCLKLHVSRQTVKNAISILKASGWLYSHQGKGNFVNDDNSLFALSLQTHLQAKSTTVEKIALTNPLAQLIPFDDIEKPFFYIKKYFNINKQLVAYSLCVLSEFNVWNIQTADLKDGLIKFLKNNNIAIERMEQQIVMAQNYKVLKKVAEKLGFAAADFPLIKTKIFKKSGEIVEKSIVILHRDKMVIKKQIFF